jgi:hypothetical protein
VWSPVRHTLFLASLIILAGLTPKKAQADQLQCNSAEVAERATKLLPAGSLVIDFCSLCESPAQVVRVERVMVVKDCDHEVELGGPVLALTQKVFKDGYEPNATWAKSSARFQNRLDLAYVYVEVARNDFRFLGGQLGLEATVNTPAIRLPEELYASLGPHPLPVLSGVPKKVELPAPAVESIRQVFAYHFQGQGRPPILVDLVPCLEVDTKKDSETRYDCLQPINGPVELNSNVSAWTTWLVPRGEDPKGILVQFIHEGIVRQTKDLTVSASGVRARAFTGTKLNKAGRWSIVVLSGGKELSRAELTVR